MVKTVELSETQIKGFIKQERKILLEWDFADVLALRPDLTPDQVTEVLYVAATTHDPANGLTIAIVKGIANKLYPPKGGRTKVVTN